MIFRSYRLGFSGRNHVSKSRGFEVSPLPSKISDQTKMKTTITTLTLMLLFGCSSSCNGLTKEKIVFKKDLIGYRTTYSISIPELSDRQHRKLRSFGGHGHGFEIIFSDSSTIYYTNDHGMVTPNHRNYETVNWKGYKFLEGEKDTVLNGQQTNGKYWKEIRKGEDCFGYFDVKGQDKEIFEKSLNTFIK